MKRKLCVSGIVLLLACFTLFCLVTGCATQFNSVYDKAALRNPDRVQVNDADIISFSNDVRQFFTGRMQSASLVKKITKTFVSVSGFAAGAIGVSSTSANREDIISLLAMTSSSLPTIERIWKEGEKAIIFQQGMSLLGMAESRYYLAMIDKDINNDNVSSAGAALFQEVNIIVSVISKFLVGQLPELEELEIIKGEGKED